MNDRQGYVYVMINPSYNGIVKIGKTTKEPEERAKELSSATGVATPFIVVYKRLFNNCDVAEQLVHDILSEKGYRVNDSREFFSLSATEAINTILDVPNESTSVNTHFNIEDNNDTYEDLADSYYNKAEEYHYGSKDTFQDENEALFYYERSAELGKIEAYRQIGKIWLNNKQNTKEALVYFHKGVDKGDFCCYAELGSIYIKEGAFYNKRNAELAYNNFFEFLDSNPELIKINEDVAFCVGSYIFNIVAYNIATTQEQEAFIYKNREPIYKHIQECITRWEENNTSHGVLNFFKEKIVPYIEKFEETYLLYSVKEEELANNYLYIAKKYVWGDINIGNSVYPQNDIKAINLLNKSIELGNYHAYVYLGISWLHKGNKQKAENAWKKYYNYVYDTITDNCEKTIDKVILLEGLYHIILYALQNNSKDLIHPYYVTIALHLNLVEYYTKKMEDLSNTYSNGIDTTIPLFNDIMTNIENLRKSQIKQLELIHSFIKEFTEECIKKGDSNPIAYRLED